MSTGGKGRGHIPSCRVRCSHDPACGETEAELALSAWGRLGLRTPVGSISRRLPFFFLQREKTNHLQRLTRQGSELLPKLLCNFFPLSKLLQNVRRISYFSHEAIPESGQHTLNFVTSAFQKAH